MILKYSVANRAKVLAHNSLQKIIQMIKARANPGTLAAIRRALESAGRASHQTEGSLKLAVLEVRPTNSPVRLPRGRS